MSKTFVREDFKVHRERLFYEREVAMLPATQEAAQLFLRVEAIEKEVKQVRLLMMGISNQANDLYESNKNLIWRNIREKDLNNPQKQLFKELRAWKKNDPALAAMLQTKTLYASDIHRLQREIRNLQGGGTTTTTAPADQERRTFLRRCGDGDCKGFLSTQWKCGICNLKTCNHCHVFLGQNTSVHECNPDDVATVKLLQTDSTPCPSCATVIFKIDGCDQMWCTQCHTAFSWLQKRIVTGPLHNPHYFEFLRNQRAQGPQQQRNPQDVLCGRELDMWVMRDFIYSLRANVFVQDPMEMQYGKWLRFVMHVREVELARFRTDLVQDNQTLRIKYLLNRITEKEFKSLLHKEWKATAKKREIYDILFMFVQASTEIFFRVRTEQSVAALQSGLNEVEALIAYVNECFQNVAALFDSVKQCIHTTCILEPYRLITQK